MGLDEDRALPGAKYGAIAMKVGEKVGKKVEKRMDKAADADKKHDLEQQAILMSKDMDQAALKN